MDAIFQEIYICSPPNDVFDAIATERGITRVFPFDRVILDPICGGRIELRGTGPDGSFIDHGIVLEYEPGRSFSYEYWSSNHGRPDTSENRVVLSYSLSATGPGTRLSVTQTNLPSDSYREIMTAAWPALLNELKAQLESADRSESASCEPE